MAIKQCETLIGAPALKRERQNPRERLWIWIIKKKIVNESTLIKFDHFPYVFFFVLFCYFNSSSPPFSQSVIEVTKKKGF